MILALGFQIAGIGNFHFHQSPSPQLIAWLSLKLSETDLHWLLSALGTAEHIAVKRAIGILGSSSPATGVID